MAMKQTPYNAIIVNLKKICKILYLTSLKNQITFLFSIFSIKSEQNMNFLLRVSA